MCERETGEWAPQQRRDRQSVLCIFCVTPLPRNMSVPFCASYRTSELCAALSKERRVSVAWRGTAVCFVFTKTRANHIVRVATSGRAARRRAYSITQK